VPGDRPGAGITRALLIGLTDSVGYGPLPGLKRGIEALEQALYRSPGGPAGTTVSVNVARARALHDIETFVRQPREPGDVLLLYLGGHAVDRDGDLRLHVDTDGRLTELPLRELHARLKTVERLLLVIDTSYAGIAVERYKWSPTTAVLCSASASSPAYDITPAGGFTLFLADAFTDPAADLDGDGLVDLGELCRYLTDRMASADLAQRPVLHAPFDPTGFVVTRNPQPPLRPRAPDYPMAERLPRLVEPFINRAAALQQLVELLGEPEAGKQIDPVALVGPLGIGKTQLALRVLPELRSRYPDGVLYASVRDGLEPAVAAFASALGYRGDGSPGEVREALIEITRGLAVLFVLDDVDVVDDTYLAYLLWHRALGDRCGLLLIGLEVPKQVASERTLLLDLLSADDSRAVARLIAEAAGRTPDESFLGSLGDANPLNLRLAASSASGSDGEAAVPESPEEALRQSYNRLPDIAAALFRRGVLTGNDALDDEIADQLVDGAAEQGAIQTLLTASLFTALPDGRADYLSESIRAFAANLVRDVEGATLYDQLHGKLQRWLLVNRRYPPEPRITRDYWTTIDQLNHTPYADAIAAFVRHPSTLPPLTIGIKAPWGAGKTSLMRMVQDRLDPPDANGDRTTIRLTELSRQDLRSRHGWRRRLDPPEADAVVTNAEVLSRAEQATARRGPAPALNTHPDVAPGTPRDWRPTVWFNPWIYQSGEQVWAGLAYEIIRQVTSRLPVGDRERFWLELNLARLDRDAVRRRVYRAGFERLLPFALVFVVAVVLSLIVLAAGRIAGTGWLTWLGTAIGGGGGLVALVGAGWSATRFLGRTAAGPLGSLVSGPDLVKSSHTLVGGQFAGAFDSVVPDPGYGTKLGFLHLVQTDMKRVLSLVAREDQPLVIFVDDLDRCSPGTVAQVIEAINLFLAGEFPDCLFVLAIEPALVAAHVEVAYKDLVETLNRGRAPGEQLSLGWRFLEKIVQLPLSLPPPMMVGGLDRYVASLLSASSVGGSGAMTPAGPATPGPDQAPTPSDAQSPSTEAVPTETAPTASPWAGLPPATQLGQINPALVERIEAAIRARRPNVATLPTVARQVQAELVPTTRADVLLPETAQAVDRIFAGLYRDADALTAINAALPALSSSNPREIKRYINLFRFYTFIVQRQRLDGLFAPPADCIAKVAALAIRWPQLLSTLGHAQPGDVLPGQGPPGQVASLVAVLEQAARSTSGADENWARALRQAGLTRPAGTVGSTECAAETLPEWSAQLRSFLAAGPEVGHFATRLL
jgi:KAP family P-loop domain